MVWQLLILTLLLSMCFFTLPQSGGPFAVLWTNQTVPTLGVIYTCCSFSWATHFPGGCLALTSSVCCSNVITSDSPPLISKIEASPSFRHFLFFHFALFFSTAFITRWRYNSHLSLSPVKLLCSKNSPLLESRDLVWLVHGSIPNA